MYRIDNPTAIPYLPALPPSAAPGFFTDGNPAAALEATVVDAWWLNQLQEEILTVTGAAGIAPDRGRHTQLFEALEALYQRNGVIGNYLPLTGGTLSGFLTLYANPVEHLHAATKYYVDHLFGTLDLSGFLPITGGTLYRPGAADILGMDVDEGHEARMLFNVRNTHMWGIGARADGNFEIGDWNRGGAVLVIDADATVTMVGSAFIQGSLTIAGEGGFNAVSGQIWNNFRVNGEMSALGDINSSARMAANSAWIGGGGLSVAGRITAFELDISDLLSAVPGRVWAGTNFEAPNFQARIDGVEIWQALLVNAPIHANNGATIIGLVHSDTLVTNAAATIGTTLTANGAATIGGVLRANGNRILSYGGNNPSLAMVNLGAAPGFGMWVGGNPGRLTIGTADTAGNPLANLVTLDGAGDLTIGGSGRISTTGQSSTMFFTVPGRTWSVGVDYTLHGGVPGGQSGAFVINDVSAGAARLTIDLIGTFHMAGTVHMASNCIIGNPLYGPGNLSIDGWASKPGGGVWGDVSDHRLKTDVRDYERGLAEIRRLRPVAYQFNGLGGTRDDGKVYHGLIAQEAGEVMPEMVGEQGVKLHAEDPDDTPVLTLDCTALIFALVNAVQELAGRLEAIEARRTT